MHSVQGMQRQKRKEEWVARQLAENGFTAERELRIAFTCFDSPGKFASLDHVTDMGRYIGIGETDEFQHKGNAISCELRRMMDVSTAIMCAGETRPQVWFRYNPDGYKVDGCRKKITWKEKMAILVQAMKTHIPTQSVEIVYLFYDTINGKPAIFNDVAYDETVKSMVVKCFY